MAKQLIMFAKIAGAGMVKFQTYAADKLATNWAQAYWCERKILQHEWFKGKSQLSENSYKYLFEYARDLNIDLISTPFDEEAVDMLSRLGMKAFKIASADITNFPLITRVAKTGRPVFLSTGASRYDEIEEAVTLIQKVGVLGAIFHCTLAYPTHVENANLQRILELRRRFPEILVGYSDHTLPHESNLACPIAVAYGARIIEKHFTLNKDLQGDDHYHAVDFQGLCQLVKSCNSAKEMSDSVEEISECEMPARTNARRSLVAARNLKEGDRISIQDIGIKRPGTGMLPKEINSLLGRVLKRDVMLDQLFEMEMFLS